MHQLTEKCVDWIADFFKSAGRTTAVVGVSGGKDSAVCAALCARALGPRHVKLIYLPKNSKPAELDVDANWKYIKALCRWLAVYDGRAEALELPVIAGIGKEIDSLKARLGIVNFADDSGVTGNMMARMRMMLIYAYAQSLGGALVCNTSNLDERLVGYETIWGDAAGDFSPLGLMHVSEVIEMGCDLGLAPEIIARVPEDGLCGKSDEESLGFTYGDVEWLFKSLYTNEMLQIKLGKQLAALPRTLRMPTSTAKSELCWIASSIAERYERNRFKLDLTNIPVFCPQVER